MARLLPALVLATACAAAEPLAVELSGAPEWKISWSSKEDYKYQIETSENLNQWTEFGPEIPGTGEVMTHQVDGARGRMFFRVRETHDPPPIGFLQLPREGAKLDLVDGVGFAFHLAALEETPSAILLYQRKTGGEEDWCLIGRITEFDERKGVPFVRGSVVWIPSAQGRYEIKAEALDELGEVTDSTVREVKIGMNLPPVVRIMGTLGGQENSPAAAQLMQFQMDIHDPDGDAITRVEFYDDGHLIGTDREAPYGDGIQDADGRGYHWTRGIHHITAKAYDSRGAIGVTETEFVVEIVDGNARPSLTLTNPTIDPVVKQGAIVTVAYEADDADGVEDLTELEVVNLRNFETATGSELPTGAALLDTTNWEAGNHPILVRVVDADGSMSYPQMFTIFVNQEPNSDFPEKLVNHLTDNSSAVASGMVFHGSEASSGVFKGGHASGLQMNDGILLTTGLFSFWNGGNVSGHTGYMWDGPGDDRLRDRLSAGQAEYTTHDAASLEFDLYCENGQLEFEFQFGSEEYLEYVDSYNDGLLITVDDVIVSLTPDCEEIVSVNSIHEFVPADVSRIAKEIEAKRAHLYLSNDEDIAPTLTPENLSKLVEYDGMTIKLRGHVLLEPGTTHRVRIVIADTNDSQWDSAVFLEKNSLRTVDPAAGVN